MACHQLPFSEYMNPAAWKLASKSLEACGCRKRNLKHTEELRIIRDSQCCCYFLSVTQCLQSQKSFVSSVSLGTTAQSVRAHHTKGKINPARSHLTPRAVSHSPVPGRSDEVDALPGKLSGRERIQQVQMAVPHSLAQQKQTDLHQSEGDFSGESRNTSME